MAYLLRRLQPDDAAVAAALIRAAFGGIEPPLQPSPSALGETTETVAAQIAEGGGMTADASGILVGVVLWQRRDDGLYIGRLSVAQGWRRRGIAIALLQAAETQARHLGLLRLSLGTRLMLAGNRALFAKFGFTEGATHAHPGFTHPTWVGMDKRLAP